MRVSAGSRRTGQRPAVVLAASLLAVGAAAAAPPTFALRYRFSAGQTLIYATHTSAVGQVTEHSAKTGGPGSLPLGLDISDRTRYEVKSVAADGTATIEARLLQLSLSSTIPGQLALLVDRRADQTEVHCAGKQWTIANNQVGKPVAEIVAAAGGWDPLTLLAPTVMTVATSGQTTRVSGLPWVQRLGQWKPCVGLAPFFQPFGPGFLELPDRSLELGAEWDQTRQLPLPGSTSSYPLQVVFGVEGKQTLGKDETAKIGFEGAATLQDKTIRVEVETGSVPVVLETLTHHLRGGLNFNCEAGRLVEQHLKSELSTVGVGGPNHETTIESSVTVEATMSLMPE